MKKVEEKAYAKINLVLNIGDRRPDGYHDIQTVMQSLELHDDVTVELAGGTGIVVTTNVETIPTDENNLVVKAVKAFAEWFGSAETQAAWAEEFDSFPCNQGAVELVYGSDVPEIYLIKNFALTTVEGTDMTYAAYVAAHSSEWTNIMTNLGFYWADASNAPAEPDWDNLDWATLTQKAE